MLDVNANDGAVLARLDGVRRRRGTVQALDDCDTLTDTFTVTTVDGTEQVVTITIQGADDGRGYMSYDLMA